MTSTLRFFAVRAERARCRGKFAALWRAAVCSSLILGLPSSGVAQVLAVTPRPADATIAPAGILRLSLTTSWTRFDELYGAAGGGLQPFGSVFSAPSVGVAQLPAMGGAQTGLSALTGSSVAVSLGTLTTAANARILVAPLAIEYGLTKRLSLSVVVPLVETRVVVVTQLNPSGATTATVGPNPAGYFASTTAFAGNAIVTNALSAASASLASQLAACASSPAASGCPALNARSSDAGALVSLSASMASAAAKVYGTSATQPGAPFVPLASSALQTAINTRIDSVRAAFATYGIAAGSGTLIGANGMAALSQLQDVLTSAGFGVLRDTVGKAEHASLGDIEVGAAFQLANNFTDSASRAFERRIALHAMVRLPTGQPTLDNKLFDIGSGVGALAVEGSMVADLSWSRRWMTTVDGGYAAAVASRSTTRVPDASATLFPLAAPTPGSVTPGAFAYLDVSPRYRVTDRWSVSSQLQLSRAGAGEITGGGQIGSAATDESAGLGFSYSNVGMRNMANPALPVEISFMHLETLHGSGGPAPKLWRDQITMRVFLPAHR